MYTAGSSPKIPEKNRTWAKEVIIFSRDYDISMFVVVAVVVAAVVAVVVVDEKASHKAYMVASLNKFSRANMYALYLYMMLHLSHCM